MSTMLSSVKGAGLGLRRDLVGELQTTPKANIDFMEVAPENWMEIGGHLGRQFRYFTDRYPMLCHGLSLSIGSPAPLDEHFIVRLKKFLDKHRIAAYSEHLSYCGDAGHLYDLIPIPFTEDAVAYVAERIQRVQTILERPLIIENVSYYAAPGQVLSEIDFVQQVLTAADCQLLLDVNNVYVNSINHRYDPLAYIAAMPTERIRYLHIAGHYDEADDLKVDTHGADVIDPVWSLLTATYQQHGVIPTLLERDFNIPPLSHLLKELDMIRHRQQAHQHPLQQTLS
ncbi:MAG TPA: hypothetical protein DCS49_02540 [Gammaproteobacteria bacterium]|nr:hypothetical protein [Gammaproteobacteria bacterium]